MYFIKTTQLIWITKRVPPATVANGNSDIQFRNYNVTKSALLTADSCQRRELGIQLSAGATKIKERKYISAAKCRVEESNCQGSLSLISSDKLIFLPFDGFCFYGQCLEIVSLNSIALRMILDVLFSKCYISSGVYCGLG